MPNFTPEDLLLYQAGELDSAQSEVMTEELLSNWTLREKYNVLKEAFARLNSMNLQSPRQQTISAIMRYAMRKPVTV
ncbi:MAG: hypothetical protein JO072_01325 [Parafilimonas sp.]|nr:hypothetical protein [Parafilimonas sp.]